MTAMVKRLRRIGLWLCAVGLVASCSWLSATPHITRGPAAVSPPPSGLRTFDEGGLTFAYPTAWQELHFSVDSSFSHLIADLATVDVPEPCATTEDSVGTRIDCQDRFHLSPDSLVVQVVSGGSPGFDILRTPAGATALTVDHLPAYMQELAPDDPAVGADTSLVWTLSNPGAEGNFYMISALVRGPDLGPIKAQLQALIASLRYDPPVAPSPQPSGASATPGPTR